MGTAFDGQLDADAGIIPRAVYEIFDKVEQMTEYTFEVMRSFMELYQEQLYDWLSKSGRKGSASLVVGTTAMNENSSRSHTIFTVSVLKNEKKVTRTPQLRPNFILLI